ncbi:hypothetical protein AAVH_15133 [Aphelenchoides avenae]|nr:hypothetical protein AAVH_15133 [Aphelenchus avenae]
MSHQADNRKRFSLVYWRRRTWVDQFGVDGKSGSLEVKQVIVGATSESTKVEKDFDTQLEAVKYLVSLVRDAVVERMDVDFKCWYAVNIAIPKLLAAVKEIHHLHVLFNTTWFENDKLNYYCDQIAPVFWNVPKFTSQCFRSHEWKTSSFCERVVPAFKTMQNRKKTLEFAGMFCPYHSLR